MSRFKVGDLVTYYSGTRYGGSLTHLPVTKVGRKYATVEINNRPVQFDLETGSEKDGAYKSMGRIETAEMTEERMARDVTRNRLVDLGISFRGDAPAQYSTDALNRIADILEAEA